MSYTEPVSEAAMRIYRPIGMAMLAIFVAAPSTMVVDVLLGPFERAQLGYVFAGLGVVWFVLLMRLSKFRRERAAARERAGTAGPRGGANLLVAGSIAVALGGFVTWAHFVAEGEPQWRMIGLGIIFLGAGISSILAGIRQTRERRAWRAGRQPEGG